MSDTPAPPPPPPPPPKKLSKRERAKRKKERRKKREKERQGKQVKTSRAIRSTVAKNTCGDGLHTYEFGVWSCMDWLNCLMCFPMNFICCPPGNSCRCTRCGKRETRVAGQLQMVEVKQYRETFDMIDINQDGMIDQEELAAVLADLPNESPDSAAYLIQAIAPRGQGVRFRDFVKMMEAKKDAKSESDIIEDLKEIFNETDLDGDGFITPKDLQLAMKRYTKHDYTAKRITRWLKVVDLNQDGKVDRDEFIKYWTKEYRKGHKLEFE